MDRKRELRVSFAFSKLVERFSKLLSNQYNEICINEPKIVFLETRGLWEKREEEELSADFLNDFCIELANKFNQRFNANNPSLSCSIPKTRFRVQALHGSVTANGSIAISIRIPSEFQFSMDAFKKSKWTKKSDGYFYQSDAFSPKEEILQWDHQELKKLVFIGKNILISGGTASGKTSFLNALLSEIPKESRVITIEDSQELHIQNENKVQIIASKYDDGSSFTYKKALNAVVRFRPDRILLGELDTENTYPFLRLSNTGHTGMISTIHANNPQGAISAIISNINFERATPTQSILSLIEQSLDYIIQLQKGENNQRLITGILDVKRYIPNHRNEF